MDPAAARAAPDRADRLLAASPADAQTRAMFARRRALLLLNTGDTAGARDKSLDAVKLLGGLTERTDLFGVSARADAGLALLLLGREDEARRYLALTGAGRLTSGSFDPAVQMRPPDCGGEAGLKPQDMAVVEFDIGADGRVLNERVIVSYPPFVFFKVGRETSAGARYAKSYRPDGGPGCGAQTQRVRFKLP